MENRQNLCDVSSRLAALAAGAAVRGMFRSIVRSRVFDFLYLDFGKTKLGCGDCLYRSAESRSLELEKLGRVIVPR